MASEKKKKNLYRLKKRAVLTKRVQIPVWCTSTQEDSHWLHKLTSLILLKRPKCNRCLAKLSGKDCFGENHRHQISILWRYLMVANRKRYTCRKCTDPKGNLHRFSSSLIHIMVYEASDSFRHSLLTRLSCYPCTLGWNYKCFLNRGLHWNMTSLHFSYYIGNAYKQWCKLHYVCQKLPWHFDSPNLLVNVLSSSPQIC